MRAGVRDLGTVLEKEVQVWSFGLGLMQVGTRSKIYQFVYCLWTKY